MQPCRFFVITNAMASFHNLLMLLLVEYCFGNKISRDYVRLLVIPIYEYFRNMVIVEQFPVARVIIQ